MYPSYLTKGIVAVYKGYNYQSITPYQIDDRYDGTKMFRILAGNNENSTKFIMYQNYQGDWYLDYETDEGDANLEIFFKSKSPSKKEIQDEVLSIVQRGFEILETVRGRIYVDWK